MYKLDINNKQKIKKVGKEKDGRKFSAEPRK